jgi:hypothetical protein
MQRSYVYKQANGKWYVKTSAGGFCPIAKTMGINIFFSGNTKLMVNGNIIQSKKFSIPPNETYIIEANHSSVGQTIMQLPDIGRVQIIIEMSYIMKNGSGRASPQPKLKRTITIH